MLYTIAVKVDDDDVVDRRWGNCTHRRYVYYTSVVHKSPCTCARSLSLLVIVSLLRQDTEISTFSSVCPLLPLDRSIPFPSSSRISGLSLPFVSWLLRFLGPMGTYFLCQVDRAATRFLSQKAQRNIAGKGSVESSSLFRQQEANGRWTSSCSAFL